MAISDTSSISGQNASSATGNTVSSQDNEQRFLKLLVTQLNNQDPLNPMQNAELTSQLAQMSTVTGIEKLNTTLSGLVNQTGANQLLQATSLIGYNVLSPGDILTTKKPDEGKDPATQAFGVELPGTAADVTIKIVDDKGNVVRTIDAGPMKEGVNAGRGRLPLHRRCQERQRGRDLHRADLLAGGRRQAGRRRRHARAGLGQQHQPVRRAPVPLRRVRLHSFPSQH